MVGALLVDLGPAVLLELCTSALEVVGTQDVAQEVALCATAVSMEVRTLLWTGALEVPETAMQKEALVEALLSLLLRTSTCLPLGQYPHLGHLLGRAWLELAVERVALSGSLQDLCLS